MRILSVLMVGAVAILMVMLKLKVFANSAYSDCPSAIFRLDANTASAGLAGWCGGW